MTIFSIIGIILSGIFFLPGAPVCITILIGGAYIMKNASDEQKKIEQNKIYEIIEDKNINEEIKKEFEKLEFDN